MINFLEYISLLKAVKFFLCTKIKKNRSSNVQSRKLPNTPIKIKLLLKDTSGCKTYYNILSKSSVIPTSQIKYLEEGFMFTSSEWAKCYSLPFCSLKDPTIFMVSVPDLT